MKELAPHQQRVVDEKIELDKKHYTLRQFMVFSPIFPVLDPGEQRRLKDQHEVMAQYSKILGKRIDAFQPQSDSSSEPGGKDDEKENDIDMESDDFGNEYRDKK